MSLTKLLKLILPKKHNFKNKRKKRRNNGYIIINAINFNNTDSLLTIKVFNRNYEGDRLENKDYSSDFYYNYDLKKDLISEKLSSLEYIAIGSSIKVKGVNELPNNYSGNSKSSILTVDDSVSVKSKGKIRHIKLSKKEDIVGIVYLDSIHSATNYYAIEIRDANSLNLINSTTYQTKNIITKIKFLENDTYVGIYEQKIKPSLFTKSQSKSSIYWNSFRTDISLKFLETKTLKKPNKLIDIDDKDFWRYPLIRNEFSLIDTSFLKLPQDIKISYAMDNFSKVITTGEYVITPQERMEQLVDRIMTGD